VGIPRDYAAIEADVNPALPLAGGQLFVEPIQRGGGGDRVQRHVNDGGDAPRSGSSSSGVEALPFRPARLVEVNVGVD
jgi:hypothetical protein